MNKTRICGCKGYRTCLICEKTYGLESKDFISIYKDMDSYIYCPKCNKLYPGWDTNEVINNHNNHQNMKSLNLPGIAVYPDFLTPSEGEFLTKNLDKLCWQKSQSGRRKQNFGPKANFKKKKIQLGSFNGFPKFSEFVQTRFNSVKELENFQTIEQCTLEYTSKRGASIEPHIDDCWIWGERVVTVNTHEDSVLTLSAYSGQNNKYNLNFVDTYKQSLSSCLLDEERLKNFVNVILRVPMPSLSLVILYGPARYQFEHSVLREDITERRVCIAYREFTPMYMEGGVYNQIGQEIKDKAKIFW